MIRVGLFFRGKINALTGASTVLRNIISGFEKQKEVNLWAFMLDVDRKVKKINKKSDYKSLVRHFFLKEKLRLKSHEILGKYSKSNLLIAKFYVWLLYHRNVKKVIDSYGYHAEKMDILFFHEVNTAFYLKQKHQKVWRTRKKVIVLHTNGEVLKMFFSYFPVLEKNKKTNAFYHSRVHSILQDMDKIVLLSEFAKRNFINVYPEYRHKTDVVPNGLDVEAPKDVIKKVPGPIIFTTVGTVCERKGHDIIVDAVISMTEQERSLFKINFVGEGNILNTLKTKCEQNSIANIEFIGASTEVNNYLLQSDVFLLASRDEGLPMAIIEAMACSLPILSTNVGGIPDLIDNEKNGWLIEPSVEELKEVIKSIIDGKYDVKEMGNLSEKMYEDNYTQSKMILRYQKIFEDLLQ